MSDDTPERAGEPSPVPSRTYVTGDAYGAMPPRTPPTPARASLPMFLTGVVLIVATSVMGWQFFHRDAGYAAWWWGGYLLALGLWRGAWTRYSAARAETRLPLGGGGFAVVLVGEIGGQDEVHAARYFQEHMSKPVVGFMAGVTAPPGRRMGHAGAIVGGEDDTAAAKIRKLEAAGIPVARVISEVATLLPA